MTVKELREALEGVPDYVEVEIVADDYSYWIESVSINGDGKLIISA